MAEREAVRITDRRRLRGRESRQAIIEGAIACIARRGLGGTTLEGVARRAGVSRALVAFHFKSKNQLLIEVLDALGARFSAGWDAILADPALAPEDKLMRLLAYDVGYARRHPNDISVWHAFWGEANGSTLYREVSSPRDRRYMADVSALIEAVAARGEPPTIAVEALVKGIEAMLFGFWLDAHLDPTAEREKAALEALETLLRGALGKRFGTRETADPRP